MKCQTRSIADVLEQQRFLKKMLSVSSTSYTHPKDWEQLWLNPDSTSNQTAALVQAQPFLPIEDPNMRNIAEFLSFSQHVQYYKTKKLAFISDFQGMSLQSVFVLIHT